MRCARRSTRAACGLRRQRRRTTIRAQSRQCARRCRRRAAPCRRPCPTKPMPPILGQAGNGGNGNSSTAFGVVVQLTRLSSASSAGIGGCCSSPMLTGALSHALSVCCLGRGGSLSLLLDGDTVGVPILDPFSVTGELRGGCPGARPVSRSKHKGCVQLEQMTNLLVTND